MTTDRTTGYTAPSANQGSPAGNAARTDADPRFDALIAEAIQLGATGARIIDAKAIVVEDHLAALCHDTRCENFGQSMSCPPNVAGPDAFRGWQQEMEHALVIQIEVPMEYLLGAERAELMKLLHLIVSGVELAAKRMGFAEARGFAGDSCKKLFCHDFPECRVLDEGGPCRHPDEARPSMSGFGINVGRLMEIAGWQVKKIADRGATGTVTGLILLG